MLKQLLIMAYATLVCAEKYILVEDDRTDDKQLLIPENYIIDVAEYLVK